MRKDLKYLNYQIQTIKRYLILFMEVSVENICNEQKIIKSDIPDLKNGQTGLLEVKNTITEIRNSVDQSIKRFNTAEKQISELEDRSEENIQKAGQREQIKKYTRVATRKLQ